MQGSGAKGKSKGDAQITVNQDILRAVGLVRSLDKPLKILGAGELSASLFVVADAFTGSARTKIEAAGGTVTRLREPVERKKKRHKASAPAAEEPETDVVENEAPEVDEAEAAEPEEAEAAEE